MTLFLPAPHHGSRGDRLRTPICPSGRWPGTPAAESLAGEARSTYRTDADRGAGEEPVGSDPNGRLADVVSAVRVFVDDRDTRPDPEALRTRLDLYEQLDGLVTVGRADTVKALAASGAVEADGARSTADWVKATTGRSGRDAARIARLSHDLDDLPETRAALADGRISDEDADVVARAARDGRMGSPDEVEAELLPVAASSSPEDLRTEVKDRQQAVDAAAMVRDETHQHAVRSLRLSRRETGMWALRGELPDEVGQTLRTALDAFDHREPAGTPPERRRRPEQRLVDALEAMTGVVLDRGLSPGSGGITRPHVSVIVAADTVCADLADPDATDPSTADAAPDVDDPRWSRLPAGEMAWGGKLSPQAVRRICCDAAVSRLVLAGDSQVLDVGRATREWSGPQRRAVNARDRGCRGPHCTLPIAWTSIHHLVWWSDDGDTSVDNGLALCHRCHRLVHDHGWTIEVELATSTATWTSPIGTIVTTHPHRPGHPDLRAAGLPSAGGASHGEQQPLFSSPPGSPADNQRSAGGNPACP